MWDFLWYCRASEVTQEELQKNFFFFFLKVSVAILWVEKNKQRWSPCFLNLNRACVPLVLLCVFITFHFMCNLAETRNGSKRIVPIVFLSSDPCKCFTEKSKTKKTKQKKQGLLLCRRKALKC